MRKNITDEELDALLHDYAQVDYPGHTSVDVTGAVMQRVRKMPFVFRQPKVPHAVRRAVAAIAVMVVLATGGAGFGQYQNKVANERLASMFSSVYDFHADYGSGISTCASELEIGYLY